MPETWICRREVVLHRPLSDELLIAYLDGELEATDIATVEAALARDPGLRAKASAVRESTSLMRPVFNQPMHELPPPRILAALKRGRRRALPGVGWLVAASIAALLLGAGGGYMASDWRFNQIVTLTESARLGDELTMRRALTAALETSVSGTPVSWHSPASGHSGQVVPVRTFRNAEGAFCREYRETVMLEGGEEQIFGIACRQTGGVWRTVALMTGQ